MTHGIETQAYADLFLKVLPRPIKTEAEAETIQREIDALVDRTGDLTEDESDFLGLLGALVFMWEDGKYQLPPAPPCEVVRTLMESRGLRQKDLVGPVFPTESVASEVLSGKRNMTYEFVGKLSRYFHISPDVFYFPRTD